MPRFLHALTAVHALGAVACFVMAIGSAVSAEFRSDLAVSGGSALMLAMFGDKTWAFLLFVGSVLAVLAYSGWRIRYWAWPMTLVVHGIGVLGSLWQVSMGIPQGWTSRRERILSMERRVALDADVLKLLVKALN